MRRREGRQNKKKEKKGKLNREGVWGRRKLNSMG